MASLMYQDIPLVDKSRLDQLRSIDEDGSFVKELIELFVTETEATMKVLSASIAACDLDQIKYTAHRLRGSALSLGADRLAALTSDIEYDNELTSIQNSMERLKSLHAETIAELSTEITRARP